MFAIHVNTQCLHYHVNIICLHYLLRHCGCCVGVQLDGELLGVVGCVRVMGVVGWCAVDG